MPTLQPKLQKPEFSIVFDKIEHDKRTLFLNELLLEYVDRHGLGAMPKADLDALIVHLFLKYSGKTFNAFDLSRDFKIRETRLKSLIATAGVKFEKRSELEIWMEILGRWKDAITNIESIEKGQVAFKFENPADFPFIQKEARQAGGTIAYSPSSEVIIVFLATLFRILDQVYKVVFSEAPGHQYLIKDLLEKIKSDLIGPNELKNIKQDKEKKLKLTQILSTASELASIGKVVISVFGPVA